MTSKPKFYCFSRPNHSRFYGRAAAVAALMMGVVLLQSNVLRAWTPVNPPVAVSVFGDIDSDYASSVVTDASGNVYETGYFGGTVDFDPGVGTSTIATNGAYDIFVSKLNASGELVWVKTIGGSQLDIGYAITLDSSGNPLIAGMYGGTVDFDPGVGTNSLTSSGTRDIFVMKLNTSGALVWAKSFGGTTATDTGYGVAVDSSNNVYFTGEFGGTADFDPDAGTTNLTSAGGRDIFVSKLDSTGSLVWAKGFGSAGASSNDIGRSIAVDATNNVYSTGTFLGTVDFDPGAGTSSVASLGANDTFVSKLDSSGNFVWAKTFGGLGNESGNSLAIDPSGNVILGGSFSTTVDFDPGVGTSNLISVGNNDAFVLKLDSLGNYVWAKPFGGTANADSVVDLTVDGSGNIFSTGNYESTVDFDPGVGTTNLTAVGGRDTYVWKLDSSGNFVWVKGFGGATTDTGYSVALDVSGNVWSVGLFEGTVDFDPGVGTSNLTALGQSDAYVMRMSPLGEVTLPTTTTTTTSTLAPVTTTVAPTTTVAGSVSNASAVTTTTVAASSKVSSSGMPTTGASTMSFVLWSSLLLAAGGLLQLRVRQLVR